jgi:peroxin-6
VRLSDKASSNDSRPHSSLQIPAAALALQSFVLTLQSLSPNKTLRRDSSIEIRILDVAPIGLDTVYVNLDTEALQKLDEVHAKFGGGFGIARPNGTANGPKNKHLDVGGTQNRRRGRETAIEQERSWKQAVRDALHFAHILHIGDLLPLPLAAHPITHTPPPPVKITACEPVAQGILLPTTKIVVLQSKASAKTSKLFPPIASSTFAAGVAEDEDDTSNEQFYSAAEDRNPSQTPSPPDEEYTTDNLVSDASESEAADLSDDDPEDMISLDAPMLPPQQSGVLSSYTAATPRPGGFHTNGVATPGSVFSSFTATTARGPSARSRLFKTHGLLERIPDDIIHPKPGSEDDDEARIYVETNSLVKLGCFSGDWVKIEVVSAPSENSLAFWGVGAFGTEDAEPSEWRSVKVFGLPDSMSKKPQRYPIRKPTNDRRSSISGLLQPTASSPVYLSPIMLQNLGEPTHLRISALTQALPAGAPKSSIHKGKVASNSSPPIAKEAAMLKLNAPLSVERVLQPSLFTSLKEYFERKRRIVKSGDIVGISIDESLGKAIFQGNSPDDDTENEELLTKARIDSLEDNQSNVGWKPKAVAWFKVGTISKATSETDGKDDDFWGGVYVIDATSTKMVIKDSEQGKAPAIMSNPWQYYLGAKRSPTSLGMPGKNQSILEMPKAHVSTIRRRLRELMLAATSSRAIHLGLPPLAVLITSTQRHIGKATVAIQACEDLGLHTFPIDAFDIITDGGTGGGDVKTAGTLEARAERGLNCGAEYTALLVKHVDALNADRMISSLRSILSQSRVLIATTTDVDKVPDGIRGLFTHELEMSAPDEGEREGILRSIVADSGVNLSADVDLANIAMKTAALVAGDLVDVVDRAVVARRNRLDALAAAANKALPDSTLVVTTRDIEISGGSASNSLTKADFEAAVDAARKNFADAIGAPKIPNVSWSDVGGLTHVKDAVMETIQLPLARPELFAKGMKKRSGILFYGPPGTGKTLLAKAIATEFSLNFFSVKGPELLNMYIGESEANVRRVFQRARDARPCVVFFDELDSVAPKRGNQGDSGGVMDRIVSQLLAELDGMSNGEDGGGGVFVIGATNRPDLLDQALLRPGRFDKMLYLGVSDTHDKQLTILEALTRK